MLWMKDGLYLEDMRWMVMTLLHIGADVTDCIV